MNHHHHDACDRMDACVFTGDILYTKESLEQFKEYVARWSRAIQEAEEDESRLITLAIYAQIEDSDDKDYTPVPFKSGDTEYILNIRITKTTDMQIAVDEARSCEIFLNTFEKEL